MKKVVAVLVCVVLMGLSLVGCGNGKKDGIPYFPHSDTFRVDASMEEIVKAENLEVDFSSGTTDFYKNPEAVTINKYKFDASYVQNDDGTCSCVYSLSRKDKAFDDEYEEFVKYFTDLYGDDCVITTNNPSTKYYETYKETSWRFEGDGVKYDVGVAAYQSKITGDYNLSIYAGQN